MTEDAGLVDLGYQGPAYTWTNGREGRGLVLERLDRAMATVGWTGLFPKAAVYHLPRFNSDHSPILLMTKAKPVRRRRTFRIENWWMQYPGFKEKCTDMMGDESVTWEEAVSTLRQGITKWERGVPKPDKELKEIEGEMAQIQQLNPDLMQREDEIRLQERYNEVLLRIESYWLQRSRLRWSVEGDANTAFFHATTRTRRRHNTITMLQNEDGTWTVEERQVRQLFVSHFKDIYFSMEGSTTDSSMAGLDQQTINELPQVSEVAAGYMQEVPTDLEIQGVVFSLGPDKAPGPDGVNARFVQTFWPKLGPTVTRQISRSNLVLVPKVQNPTKVTEYRPISVCNVVYKAISKILAARLKVHIPYLVKENQTAFVAGREIGDNVILLREVLNTFKSRDYKQHAFCLKTDLSKAFDKMSWRFVKELLPHYGLPAQFVSWIMECITSAELTILFNGYGDGSIKPKRGLRQGCALSPYVFILCMNVLTIMIENKVRSRELSGLKLAPTAPILTNLMYADDLLVFGKANEIEVRCIQGVLRNFCCISGQEISQQKSKLWLSRATPGEERRMVLNLFGIGLEDDSESYLGCPLDVTHPNAFHPILDKIDKRLGSWKGRLLSNAGRVVLIKSVLESTLVYYMTTTAFHKSVLSKIKSKIRRFFWGKEQVRYLAYLRWEEIAKPKCLGGAGLRDLEAMNCSFMAKNLWKIASQNGALWVRIMQAKYYPNGTLWQNNRRTRCTRVWKGMMGMREFMAERLKWIIGNGEKCHIFAEPWFNNWTSLVAANREQRQITVSSLINEETGEWDVDAMVEMVGYQNMMSILAEVQLRRTNQTMEDKLIFTGARNGLFSIKNAYRAIADQTLSVQSHHGSSKFWYAIWNMKDVAPRVRLFLWKAVRGALPVAAEIGRRLPQINPECKLCGAAEESVVHTLFHCMVARLTWFKSSLSLRTEGIQGNMDEILTNLWDGLDKSQIASFAYILWEIWKSRCACVYGGDKQSVEAVLIKAMIGAKGAQKRRGGTVCRVSGAEQVDEGPTGGVQFECWVDGAYAAPQAGGIGYWLSDQQGLVQYGLQPFQAFSSFQMEAMAMLLAVQGVGQRNITDCRFYSDSEELVHTLNSGEKPQAPDWRAHWEIEMLAQAIENCKGYRFIHIGREENHRAHRLAQIARIDRICYQGYTLPSFL